MPNMPSLLLLANLLSHRPGRYNGAKQRSIMCRIDKSSSHVFPFNCAMRKKFSCEITRQTEKKVAHRYQVGLSLHECRPIRIRLPAQVPRPRELETAGLAIPSGWPTIRIVRSEV